MVEPLSPRGSVSQKAFLRKGKSATEAERTEGKNVRNSTADTKVRAGGGGGNVSVIRVEIPLLRKALAGADISLSPLENTHTGADIHTAAHGWRATCQSGWIFSEGTAAHGNPMLE